MSDFSYQNQQDISGREINQNLAQQVNQQEIWNIDRETTKQLGRQIQIFKYSLPIIILSTVSIFYLAFCNIRSYYFLPDSIILIFLGISVIIVSFRAFKIFQNPQIPQSRKKCFLIYLTMISICIAAVSGSYLINAKQIQWCGYIVTYNGPLKEEEIKKSLDQVGICIGNDKQSINSQVKKIIIQKCGNQQMSDCNTNNYFLTSYSIVKSTTLVNFIVYLLFQMLLSIYLFHKLQVAHSQALIIQSQRYQNNRVENQGGVGYVNQNQVPQIYQAQLAPAFFNEEQRNENIIVGQPIKDHPYYNPPNPHTHYSINDISNSNL